MKANTNILPNRRIITDIKYVIDGDTIVLNYQGEEFSSRARWIDAPETQKSFQSSNEPQVLKHWEWGQRSKQFLIDLVQGQKLIVLPIELDQYKRWICDWYLRKSTIANNLQLKLCQAGMCTHYSFAPDKFKTKAELNLYIKVLNSCFVSFQHQVGIWGENDFISPYQIRKMNL
jgi:endonuclease YncB( thermonuclease family)